MHWKIKNFKFVFILSGILFVSNSWYHSQFTAAQLELQSNQSYSSLLKQPSFLGSVFNIDGIPFSHHLKTVNGIQIHYVIGGQGDPVVLLHGWPETWYEWRHVMPVLAKNYTVIVPDLRGLGDSSKPVTGYDGKMASEDIYQLIPQLGFKKIFLVGHDVGAEIAYPYAAAHHNNVKRLVILDVPILGIGPGRNLSGLWHIPFHMVRDVPEMLVQGHEREYLTWFYRHFTCNPEAITQEDIDEFVSHYSAPGGMRAGFEYYRAFPENMKQNIESSKIKLPMPVLALGGECSFGTAALESMRLLATDVHGGLVPNSGHWIPEEQPKFLVDQLFKFFGSGSSTNVTGGIH